MLQNNPAASIELVPKGRPQPLTVSLYISYNEIHLRAGTGYIVHT